MGTSTGARPPPLPGPRPPGWWDRHWRWAVPGLAAVLLGVFAALLLSGLVLFGRMMKSAEPYRHAVALARQEPRVIAVLGEPIVEGWFPFGQINFGGSGGSADLDIPLSGSRGKGYLHLQARREDSLWRYPVVTFTSGGTRIELPHDPPPAGRCEP